MLKQFSKIIYEFFQFKKMNTFFAGNILVVGIVKIPVCQAVYSGEMCQLRIEQCNYPNMSCIIA